jgi:hypothetical protein
MKKDIKESVNITCCSKERLLNYYSKLWHDRTYDKTILTSENEEENNFTPEKLEIVMEKIKNGKSPEDGINSQLYKYAGNKFHNQLLNFFNNTHTSKEIPTEWRRSIVIPIYKKGDKTNPENYRGISLLNTCYKIYSRLLNNNLKTFTEQFTLEFQNGFSKGRTCIHGIFTLKLLIERRRKFNLETHIASLDFEKAFDMVKRPLLFKILQGKTSQIYYYKT